MANPYVTRASWLSDIDVKAKMVGNDVVIQFTLHMYMCDESAKGLHDLMFADVSSLVSGEARATSGR